MLRARGLFVRYLTWIGAATVLPLLGVIGVLSWLALREAEQGLVRLHEARAQTIAVRVETFVSTVADDLGAGLRLAHRDGELQVLRRYDEELFRLLRRHPAITELALIDASGHERMARSRFEDDRVESWRDWSTHPAFVSVNPGSFFVEAAYFYQDSEPRTRIAVRGGGAEPFTLVAEVSLRLLWDLAADKRFIADGIAYVTTATGTLIAHPDRNLVLQHQRLDQLFEAGSFAANSVIPASLQSLRRVDGVRVVHTRLSLPAIQAFLVLEQAREDAYRPVLDLVRPSLLILVLALLFALVVSALLARLMVRPLRMLQDGAARLGSGDLEHRIQLTSDDELGDLSKGFNNMAGQLREERSLLETRVAERTADLAKRKDEIETLAQALQEKKEEAESASAAKTRFLAAASHDLRQPMHAIGLLVGVLHRRLGCADAPSILQSIQSSVEAMERLFSALLDISRLDAGIVQPHFSEFPLESLFFAIEADLGVLAREKGIELRVAHTSAWVRSDPQILERIVRNLVSNAIRYTPKGKVLLGCRRVEQGRGLGLQVIDTGIGIATEDASRIFMEFVQVGNRERDRTKGLGLGLSIVKRSAELLGHPLAVRSTPGVGSCFSVELPRAARHVSTKPGANREDGFDLAGCFVAFIDDDPEIRLAMAALLELWECHAAIAGSADEAAKMLSAHLRQPDVIICDYRLAETDGIATIESLREEFGADIPGLVVTGNIAPKDLARIDAAGLLLLHKPINPGRLGAAIAMAISRSQASVTA
ncbi:MAG: HAMP domain-containing protein [Sulfuritalea sp.]|nr:HAMP domain-containing protein [Sulfuritalea sp.]